MAYNPTIWVNDDGTGTVGTPVIADYLNNIEQGVKNNDNQINVLDTRDYYSFESLGVGITKYSSIDTVINAMQNNSRLTVAVYNSDDTGSNYEFEYPYNKARGTLVVFKNTNNYTYLTFYVRITNEMYVGNYSIGGFNGWKEIVTVEQVQAAIDANLL